MAAGKLSPVQIRIQHFLARCMPHWTLSGWGAENASALVRFRDKLVDDVLALAVPEPGDRQP